MVGARFLLDTNAVREPMRPAPNPRFLSQLARHGAAIAIAAPTWHECLFGLGRMPAGRKRDDVSDYLHNVLRPSVEVLPYDDRAAEWHAGERVRLEAAGRPISFADGTIAAVAARFGLVVVTHNVRDFERFAGVTVEDWIE